MKTSVTRKKDIKKRWYLFDASSKPVGRLSSEIAGILIGKMNPNYVSYMNTGHGVVVINADKVVLTGKKETDKLYSTHSGQVGNFKQRTARQLRETNPTKILLSAVTGMLPKNRLRKERLANLKIFVGENHGLKVNFVDTAK